MARAKQVSKRKRRGAVALPVLGAAGVCLAMGGATAPTCCEHRASRTAELANGRDT
jgi:hypothetical protein